MKFFKKHRISILVALGMIMITCMPVFATSRTIELPSNQVWTAKFSEPRTGRYSQVAAECDSVYPLSGSDNFTRIQCRVVNQSGTVITGNDYYRLTEGMPSTYITIEEGYLNLSVVYFQFRGNTPSPAYTVVSYYGR